MPTRVARPVVDFDDEVALFTWIADTARRVVHRKVPKKDLEDVVSDVVLECLERRRADNGALRSARLAGLVQRMARARAHDLYRRTNRRGERDDEYLRTLEDGAHTWMHPHVTLEAKELDTLFVGMLAGLPERSAHAYSLVRDDHLSHQRAALILGVNTSSIASHVMRVQDRFRRGLEAHGVVAQSATSAMKIAPSMRGRPAWRTLGS